MCPFTARFVTSSPKPSNTASDRPAQKGDCTSSVPPALIGRNPRVPDENDYHSCNINRNFNGKRNPPQYQRKWRHHRWWWKIPKRKMEAGASEGAA